MGIAAEFSAILGDLANLSGLVNNLFNLGAKQDTAASTLANTQVLIVGMAVLQQRTAQMAAQLDAIQTNQNNLQSNLGYAISLTQQASQPVTLPIVAPATFLDATNDGTASAIWNYTDFRGLFTAFGALYDVYNLVTGLTQSFALPTIGPAHFVISGAIAGVSNVNWPLLGLPSTDTILSTDANVGAWLNRQTSPLVWSFITGQQIWRHTFTGPPLFEVDCTLSESEFRWFRLANSGTVPGTLLPPIWPGIANVTLGTPVPFSGSTLSVAGPLDGVIVTITAVNQPLPHYAYGTAVAWGKLGGLTFVDDRGDAEEYQLFGFVDALYVPRAMLHAASCQIRNVSGIVGTVTPWTNR